MLHGLGGSSNFFTPQMSVVGSRFRVIRPDLPGSGRSPRASPLTMQRLLETLTCALQVLGITQAHFMGHSMGTIVCQHLAVQQPRMVQSLALLGPLLAPADAARQALRERAARARTEGMADIADAIVKGATSGDTKSNNPVGVALIRELLMRQDPEGYASNCEALAECTAADVSQVACRTLLVGGDEDTVVPASNVRAMAQQIPGARAAILNRCGHWIAIERTAEVNRELHDFYFGRR
jgi:3-oxoadipate enol-lactonase